MSRTMTMESRPLDAVMDPTFASGGARTQVRYKQGLPPELEKVPLRVTTPAPSTAERALSLV